MTKKMFVFRDFWAGFSFDFAPPGSPVDQTKDGL